MSVFFAYAWIISILALIVFAAVVNIGLSGLLFVVVICVVWIGVLILTFKCLDIIFDR